MDFYLQGLSGEFLKLKYRQFVFGFFNRMLLLLLHLTRIKLHIRKKELQEYNTYI